MRTLVCLTLCFCASLVAQSSPSEQPPLRVGIKASPPFTDRDATGEWTGLSVELLQDLARAEGRTLTFEEAELGDILDAVAGGTFDVGVAALTITPEREARFDFTHSYMDSGLAIAVPNEGGRSWTSVLLRFLSGDFLQVVAALGGLLLVVGILVWFFERGRNSEEFENEPRGILSGFWFAAVTMTTVGYGDKAPKTPGGRVIALFWMFASIIIISSITAAIAASLTVSELDSPIRGPEDLARFRVATVADSTGAAWLSDRGIVSRTEAGLDRTLELLAEGEVDCVVFDAPILQHRIASNHPGQLTVLAARFSPQRYALALPPASPLREPFNRSLLEALEAPGWKDRLRRYALDR